MFYWCRYNGHALLFDSNPLLNNFVVYSVFGNGIQSISILLFLLIFFSFEMPLPLRACEVESLGHVTSAFSNLLQTLNG